MGSLSSWFVAPRALRWTRLWLTLLIVLLGVHLRTDAALPVAEVASGDGTSESGSSGTQPNVPVRVQLPLEAKRQSLERERAELLRDAQLGRLSLRDPAVQEKLRKLNEGLLRLQPLIRRNPANAESEQRPNSGPPPDHATQSGEHRHRPHELGEELAIECLTPDLSSWEPMQCRNQQDPVVIRFGLDTDFQCSWPLESDAAYTLLRDALAMQRAIHCRVPLDNELSAGHLRFFAPVTITLWGIAEGSHLHVNTHVNFVFHAHRGYILGAAAYSVRDHFQIVQPGGVLQLHGKVHWFDGHAFVPYVHEPFRLPPAAARRLTSAVLALWLSTLVLSGVVFTLFYKKVLKVRLIRRLDPTFKAE
jgi:hypothetical protein